MNDLRLYAIISREALTAAGGARGKMMAQAGHAFLHAYWDAEARFPEHVRAYRQGRAKKIVLVAENAAELIEMAAKIEGFGVSLVRDAALTVFPEPTITALGIGPIDKDEVPDWLAQLPGLT